MKVMLFLLYVGVLYFTGVNTGNVVDYYEELIQKSLKEADEFQLPQDAKMYEPKELRKPKDFGSFDFVIVGAGATGSVIANRLSEVKEWKILLLEAGEFGNNFTQIPAYGFASSFSNYNWGFTSIPQTTACLGNADKKCPYPRGRGVGGTTLINGLAYVRGNPKDFDRWAEMGNPGWSYDEVLPYFKKSENIHKTDPDAPVDFSYHGKNGSLHVEYHLPRSPHVNAFLEAGQELGYSLTDYNGRMEIGVSPMQMNLRHGKRQDGGTAFLNFILNRNNLKVMINSYVIKIQIDKITREVTGVIFTHKGETYNAKVRREAVISAGAINTPQLLMLSGIGPKTHLEALNISVIEDLEVGSTLRDHSQYFGLSFSSNTSLPIRSIKENIEDYLKGIGPLATAGPNEGVGFFRSTLAKVSDYPDLEIVFLGPNTTSPYFKRIFNFDTSVYESVWGGIDVTSSFQMFLLNLHQHSTGTVRLKSASPYDYPIIDSNFLSDSENHDMKVLYEGIKLALKLIETKPFQKINAKLQVRPVPACKDFKPWSEDYWLCSLRYLTFNVYHPMGTCPMGPDTRQDSVVNEKLKVHRVKKMRVADASVFPETPSGHPNAPCVMVGEKVSDLIKIEHLN